MSEVWAEDLEDMDPDKIEVLNRNYAETHRTALSDAEATAVQLLHEDGWTIGELEMTFQVNETAIRRAAKTGEP